MKRRNSEHLEERLEAFPAAILKSVFSKKDLVSDLNTPEPGVVVEKKKPATTANMRKLQRPPCLKKALTREDILTRVDRELPNHMVKTRLVNPPVPVTDPDDFDIDMDEAGVQSKTGSYDLGDGESVVVSVSDLDPKDEVQKTLTKHAKYAFKISSGKQPKLIGINRVCTTDQEKEAVYELYKAVAENFSKEIADIVLRQAYQYWDTGIAQASCECDLFHEYLEFMINHLPADIPIGLSVLWVDARIPLRPWLDRVGIKCGIVDLESISPAYYYPYWILLPAMQLGEEQMRVVNRDYIRKYLSLREGLAWSLTARAELLESFVFLFGGTQKNYGRFIWKKTMCPALGYRTRMQMGQRVRELVLYMHDISKVDDNARPLEKFTSIEMEIHAEDARLCDYDPDREAFLRLMGTETGYASHPILAQKTGIHY